MSTDFKISLPERKASEISQSEREQAEAEALLHKPNWTHWTNLAICRIDDAIVLSCDIDPAWHGNRLDIILVRERKDIVESHIAAGTLHARPPVILGSTASGDYLIPLSEFRAWGESLPTPFTFPEEFPTTIGEAKPWTVPDNKPLDTRTRTTLLRVIRALDVMAKLPTRGAATSIEMQLQTLGFDGPKDATIRNLLDEARALEPDKKAQ